MPESNQQLEELFNQAIELSPEERPAFFARLRASDQSLAAEVESLVSAYGQVGTLLASPAYEAAAELIAIPPPELCKGAVVGRYEIIGPLGKGGMGEVYLARDPKLDRQVALKFLPAAFTQHRDRLRRFIQEARAASALNHPNIITIHEIGEEDGAHFIATEFIAGETLRKRLSGDRMSIPEVLDVAVQICSAIEAAHGAGIIHRDLKPENVMLRPDGYVKVLDFGLAKLTEDSPGSQSPSAESLVATRAQTGTQPGMVLGTIHYMSPEQARGRPVDARTDIFSLGVLIYEMVTGRLPFDGETTLDALVAILEKEPPPLSRYLDDPPVELQRIVSRALSKERDERHRTVSEMLVELKGLKEDLTFKARLDGVRPASRGGEAAGTGEPEARTGANLQATTSAQVERNTLARRPRRFALPLAVAVAIIGLIFAFAFLRPRKVPPQTAGAEPSVSAPERQVSYSITAQQHSDKVAIGDPFPLKDDSFSKDYWIRLLIGSTQPGYLYLLNEGPPESDQPASYNVLFPSDATAGSAELPDNPQVQIPRASWLQFDQHESEETIWLVWASSPVQVLESVKKFANPTDRGEIKSAEQNAGVRDFLKNHKSETPIIENDSNKTTVKAIGDVLVYALKLKRR